MPDFSTLKLLPFFFVINIFWGGTLRLCKYSLSHLLHPLLLPEAFITYKSGCQMIF